MKLCKDVIDLLLPIGSIITNSSPNFDPNEYYSNSKYSTTWVRIKGKVIVGVDEDDSDFNTVNKLVGNKQVIVQFPVGWSDDGRVTINQSLFNRGQDVGTNHWTRRTSAGNYATGIYSGNETLCTQTLSTLQPTITKYVWERTT